MVDTQKGLVNSRMDLGGTGNYLGFSRTATVGSGTNLNVGLGVGFGEGLGVGLGVGLVGSLGVGLGVGLGEGLGVTGNGLVGAAVGGLVTVGFWTTITGESITGGGGWAWTGLAVIGGARMEASFATAISERKRTARTTVR